MPEIILIVEDHDALRISLQAWLECKFPGLSVTVASSGEEAVGITRSISPNLVVMDYKLPGMNGFEATRQIKAILPSAQIVMFSVREGDAYRASAISAGACNYVSKRAYQTELIPILTALLNKTQN